MLKEAALTKFLQIPSSPRDWVTVRDVSRNAVGNVSLEDLCTEHNKTRRLQKVYVSTLTASTSSLADLCKHPSLALFFSRIPPYSELVTLRAECNNGLD